MENRNPSFYHIPWFERLWWYRSQFLQTLHGFNPSVKVHAPENPYKNGEFLMCFYRENPVKSDTELALIEGMLMNLMFLVIYIPVVLFENWLRVTHSQRRECLRPHRGSNAALAC